MGKSIEKNKRSCNEQHNIDRFVPLLISASNLVYNPTAEGSKPVKFRNQWTGPFQVAGKRGELYELETLDGVKQRGLFHPIKLVKVNEERPHWGLPFHEI